MDGRNGSLAAAEHPGAEPMADGFGRTLRRGPQKLSEAWRGKFRYGASGSLVCYIDQRHGRKTLTRLLAVVNQNDLLKELKVSEKDLLSSWVRWVQMGGERKTGLRERMAEPGRSKDDWL